MRLQAELAQRADPFVAAAVERLDTSPGVGTEVAQTMLVIVYHVLQRQENYHELGGDYFDREAQQQQQQRLVRQLQALGFHGTIAPLPTAA